MSCEQRLLVRLPIESTEFEFPLTSNAVLHHCKVSLFTEGSLTLATTLTFSRDGQVYAEHICPMPDSYQNFSIDFSELSVKVGDVVKFSVNQTGTICSYDLHCTCDGYLQLPMPYIPVPEQQEDEEQASLVN